MKLSGSYSSISRGVSQQVAQQRLDGQHQEQINLVSDPVSGLVRRRGSQARALKGLTLPNSEAATEYMRSLRNFDFRVDGVQYTMLYPTGLSTTPVVECYTKHSTTFLPVALVGSAGTYMSMGLHRVTQVGDLLVMAVKGVQTTFTRSGDMVTDPTNPSTEQGTVWIRSGNYSRKYTITIRRAGLPDIVASYTTPSANYPGSLSTSDIPYSSPEYSKLVNDRVNAYNSAVTAWLTTAAAQVAPAHIAEQLRVALSFQGVTATVFETNHIGIPVHGGTSVSVSDGGSGETVKVLWRSVKSVEDLPYGTINGKRVEVRPNNGDDRFYMQAEVDGGGWGPARWVECPRVDALPGFMFLLGIVKNGTMYIADSATSLNTAAGTVIPTPSPRAVGDADSSPEPNFFGKEVNYVGMFQDRLVVCSGSVISMSGIGDYFNFFRSSVLTVRDNDPVEVYALGADDDIIRHSVFFDKSIVFFGERQQYTLDGRQPITPGTTTVIQSSAHEDATDAQPVSRGELVFFTKRRENLTKVNQIEVGDVQDTSRVTEVSLQLSDYIGGHPVQLVGVTNPDMLLLRSTGDYSTVVTYRYLDQGAQRVLDSWSKWVYSKALGDIVAMTSYEDQILLFHYIQTEEGGYLVVASQSLLTQVDSTPYLDMHVPLDVAETQEFWVLLRNHLAVAVGDRHRKAYLQGEQRLMDDDGEWVGWQSLLNEYPDLSMDQAAAGVEFDAFVDLTSPFRRDQNKVAVTTGRLTVTRVDVSYRDTPGLDAYVQTARGVRHSLNFNGRLLGSASSEYPYTLATSSVPVFVGRETREYVLRIQAKDWRPFTLTAVEWTGQAFYSARR